MTSGPLDILVLGDATSIHIRRFVDGLSEAGLCVGVVGFDPVGYPESVRVISIGGASSRSDLRFALAIPKLVRVIRRHRPAILNAHYVSSYGLMASLSLRLLPRAKRPRLVQTAWGTDLLVTANSSNVRGYMAKFALRAADLVTGDSRDLEAASRRHAGAVPFHRFLFGPPEWLLRAPRRDDHVLVSPRRLDPDTRIPMIVSGFLLAQATDPERMRGWRLVVAGDGTDRGAVAAAANGSELVILSGWQRSSALHDLLLGARAIISIPVSDATSAALLEAMAAGAAPIVNDLPANREWVDVRVGWVLPKDPQPEDIRDAILAAVATSPDIAKVRQRILDATWEAEISRLVDRLGTLQDVRFP